MHGSMSSLNVEQTGQKRFDSVGKILAIHRRISRDGPFHVLRSAPKVFKVHGTRKKAQTFNGRLSSCFELHTVSNQVNKKTPK